MDAEPSGSRRILVVNDDPVLLQLMRDLLENVGTYRVQTCRAAEDAIGCVDAARPDLVILDIVFGGQPLGWSVLERLEQDEETRHVPVLVTTAAGWSLSERPDLLDRQAVSVMSLPFGIEEFLQAVGSALGRRSGPTPTA